MITPTKFISPAIRDCIVLVTEGVAAHSPYGSGELLKYHIPSAVLLSGTVGPNPDTQRARRPFEGLLMNA